jgi:hypothetical protein
MVVRQLTTHPNKRNRRVHASERNKDDDIDPQITQIFADDMRRSRIEII